MSHSLAWEPWRLWHFKKCEGFLRSFEPIEENPKSKNKNSNQNFSRKADVVAAVNLRSSWHFGSGIVFCVGYFHLIDLPLFCVFSATESETIIFHFRGEKAPVKSRGAQPTTVWKAVEPGAAFQYPFVLAILCPCDRVSWMRKVVTIHPFPHISWHVIQPIRALSLRVRTNGLSSCWVFIWVVGFIQWPLVSPWINQSVLPACGFFPFLFCW